LAETVPVTIMRPGTTLAEVARPTERTGSSDGSAGEAEALFREARRRRRRRRVGWTLLAAAAVVATVASVSLLSSPASRHGQRVAAGTAAPRAAHPITMPDQIVGWTPTDRLVVVSSRTGRIEHTLATDVSVFAPGIPSVSVAPDGTVYFESATPAYASPTTVSGDQILSVSINGGPVRDVGSGSDPQVSPDGRLLAYIAPAPSGAAGEAPYLVPPQGIDIATLSTAGGIQTIRTLEPGPSQVDQGASDLSWSSDGRLLSFTLYNPTSSATTAWIVPSDPGVSSLASAAEIPLHGPGLTWNGFSGSTSDGDPQGIGAVSAPSDGRQSIVTIDARTGRITARLFRVPAAVCESIAPAGSNGCSSPFSNPVVADMTGSNVLVSGAIPYGDGAPITSGVTSLYLWHRGLHAPLRLTGGVDVASWGPQRSRP
jgi:hypothetical protein